MCLHSHRRGTVEVIGRAYTVYVPHVLPLICIFPLSLSKYRISITTEQKNDVHIYFHLYNHLFIYLCINNYRDGVALAHGAPRHAQQDAAQDEQGIARGCGSPL